MVNRSKLEIIKAKPIGKGLNAFRAHLTNIGLQNLRLSLISALQTLLVARLLHSTNSSKNLFSDLLRFPTIIGFDDFDIERIIPLLKAVYGLITESTPLFTVTKPLTPFYFIDTFDLRKDVNPILKSEVEDNLRIDHPDVFSTFFRQISQLYNIATALPLFKEDIG
ncbi:serine threonine kinase Sgk2 [Cenococcum geophilum]